MGTASERLLGHLWDAISADLRGHAAPMVVPPAELTEKVLRVDSLTHVSDTTAGVRAATAGY